jgi:hypothetical protein
MTLPEFHVRFRFATVLLAALTFFPMAVAANPDSGEAADNGIELIMVEALGCRFCLRWDAEVGRLYPSTAEGRFAPLRRVQREASLLSPLKPIVYTPTFILFRSGRELGRITGYPGESYFWEELGELLKPQGFIAVARDNETQAKAADGRVGARP